MRLAVTMTSDFICPWCYIGEAHMAAAIARLPASIQVDATYRPFELNPEMPAEGRERQAYRIAKFGSLAKSQALDAQVAAAGAAAGLAINHARMVRTPNTTLAHRLMWATIDAGGDQAGLATRLFTAYFTDGQDISDKAVLRAVADAVGLPPERTDAVLDGDMGLAEVRALTRQAYARGINGVPMFEIGGYALSGAQPVEVLERALLWAADQVSAAA